MADRSNGQENKRASGEHSNSERVQPGKTQSEEERLTATPVVFALLSAVSVLALLVQMYLAVYADGPHFYAPSPTATLTAPVATATAIPTSTPQPTPTRKPVVTPRPTRTPTPATPTIAPTPMETPTATPKPGH
jgi:hypothetical protein